MQGSTWPTAADSFANPNEGTTAFTAALLMELALAAEAIQLGVGANPYDYQASHGYSASFSTVASALKKRCRFEVGSATFGAGNTSVAVSFAHARYTTAPIVVVQRIGASAPGIDQCYEVGNRTTSGFTCYRHDGTNAENFRYLAIQFAS